MGGALDYMSPVPEITTTLVTSAVSADFPIKYITLIRLIPRPADLIESIHTVAFQVMSSHMAAMVSTC